MKNLHDIEKRYYEHFAKLLLEKIFGYSSFRLNHSDSPDLINFDGNGIEVTRAMYCGEAEASKLYSLSVNKNSNKVKCSLLKRINDLDYQLLEHKEKIFAIGPKEAIWESTREIEIAFIDKLKKATNYGENTLLFIFAPTIDYCNYKMINDFTMWAANKQKNLDYTFLKIYIFDYRYLYVCDLSEIKTSIVFIKNEDIKQIEIFSKSYVTKEM